MKKISIPKENQNLYLCQSYEILWTCCHTTQLKLVDLSFCQEFVTENSATIKRKKLISKHYQKLSQETNIAHEKCNRGYEYK